MVSKSYCPYCTQAKNVLKKEGINFEVLEIENDANMNAIQDHMAKITGARSVPRVFINGKFEGGCDGIVAKQKSGALKALVA